MLESQLRQNRFFSLIGAYSIDPGKTGAVRRSLRYTIALLNQSEKPPVVCLFPQGALLPWHRRPVRFEPGVEFILRHMQRKIQVSFLGIRVEMLDQQHPEVFFRFSPLQTIRPGDSFSIQTMSRSFGDMLDSMESEIVKGVQPERCLFRGRVSVNDRFRNPFKRGARR